MQCYTQRSIFIQRHTYCWGNRGSRLS